jgi:hypothetical protein
MYWRNLVLEMNNDDKKEFIVSFLNWMNEVWATDPMRLETDPDDIAEMFVGEAKGDAKGQGNEVVITLEDYHYECGDGCCSEWGTITTVNGKELPFRNDDVETILHGVLCELGYKVEIEHK